MEILKGIGIVLLVPLAVIMCMTVLIVMFWPFFCIGLAIVFLGALLSSTLGWVLFSLLMLFMLAVTIGQGLK